MKGNREKVYRSDPPRLFPRTLCRACFYTLLLFFFMSCTFFAFLKLFVVLGAGKPVLRVEIEGAKRLLQTTKEVWQHRFRPPVDHNLHMALEHNISAAASHFSSSVPAHLSSHMFRTTTVDWPPLMEYPPPQPSKSYPPYRPLLDVIKEWNPDHPDPPPHFTETLQHFNYSNAEERAMAERFRNAEIPFKLYDVPEFYYAMNKWTDEYLASQLDRVTPHVEESKSNHFMYWNLRGSPEKGYEPPTDIVDIEFNDWLSLAKAADVGKLANDTKHYYFMTGSLAGDRTKSFIAKDLPVFSTQNPNFFITAPHLNKGIQCRFGMRGIIAEAHYDSGRNMVAMLKGNKRYIIAPPSACKQLGIITDTSHPSYRHSVIDWSDVAQATSRGFDKVPAIDTIVRTGEVLYIPSFWFHYIISLEYSIQCNSRSGFPPKKQGALEISECMGTDIMGVGGMPRKKKRRQQLS